MRSIVQKVKRVRAPFAFATLAVLIGFGAKTCAGQHEDCSDLECYVDLTCMAYSDEDGIPPRPARSLHGG